MIRGRIEETKNFQKGWPRLCNRNKNNNRRHNCLKERHYRRNFQKLKKDNESTWEFGGVTIAS